MTLDSKIHKIDNIHVEVSNNWILRRLGYEKGEYPDRNMMELIRQNISSALSVCNCSGAYRVFKIESKDHNLTTLEGNIKIKSISIAKFLRECHYAVFMFATAGKKIVEEIENNIHANKMTEAIILDAIASEIAEAAIEQIQNSAAAYGKKNALNMKPARFSPGFGDFALSNQKLFFKYLDMESSGLQLSKTYQIIPEKTVTAIAGLI